MNGLPSLPGVSWLPARLSTHRSTWNISIFQKFSPSGLVCRSPDSQSNPCAPLFRGNERPARCLTSCFQEGKIKGRIRRQEGGGVGWRGSLVSFNERFWMRGEAVDWNVDPSEWFSGVIFEIPRLLLRPRIIRLYYSIKFDFHLSKSLARMWRKVREFYFLFPQIGNLWVYKLRMKLC